MSMISILFFLVFMGNFFTTFPCVSQCIIFILFCDCSCRNGWGKDSPWPRVKEVQRGWCGASNHGNTAEFYISQQQAHIQTKGMKALYEWCAASNTTHCFVFIFKIPITSSIVSATWRFPHSDGSMNPASSHVFICARRPS